MKTRTIDRLGRAVSAVGLGTWQLGADWGAVSDAEAQAVLDAAAESGVTLFDTADVYGDGVSEQRIGRWLAAHPDAGILVATKFGRRVELRHEHYTEVNFRDWADRSRRNLGVERLDLVQLHCPPDPVFHDDAVFDALDALVGDDVIAAYGVSVETVDQALTSIARPGVATVQIVLNAFRLKPLDEVVPAAAGAGVGVFARVPLASGLLSGRYRRDTTFAADDHRSYNRHGEAFDVGETFSGVDFETGIEAAGAFADLAQSVGLTPATAALAWVAQRPGVSSVIPGARSPEQATANAAAGEVGTLGDEFTAAVTVLYDRYFRESIHPRW